MRKSVCSVAAAALAAVLQLTPAQARENPMPQVGQMAPNFTLPSQDGTPITLDSLRGQWVILYFCPKDSDPGCTIEANNFQRDLSKYKARNAVILGVSTDTVSSHQEFCTENHVTFHLLADPDHKLIAKYGSLNTGDPTPLADRNTFLINPQGIIVTDWTNVSPPGHSIEVLANLPPPQNAPESAAN